MLFDDHDDHDVHDDWNTSESWIHDMRQTSWWGERIIAGLWTYWNYQHLGNLSPADLETDELYRQVREADDAGPLMRQFATGAERGAGVACGAFHGKSAARACSSSTGARAGSSPTVSAR